MRKIVLFLMLMAVSVVATQAQTLKSVKPYGSKGLYEITPANDTISVTPKYSASVYTMDIDTTMTIQADVSRSNPCNQVWFELSADASKRYVTFDTGFKAPPDSLSAQKSRTWGFVYTGTNYVLLYKSAEY